MTKKTLKWRLSKLPTVEELQTLVKDKIITQDEARDILFSEETKTDGDSRDTKSLKSEIKFLRDLVEQLSKNRTHVIETIKTVERPYRRYDWYGPYTNWCGNVTLTNDSQVNAIYSTAGTDSIQLCSTESFNDIKTF